MLQLIPSVFVYGGGIMVLAGLLGFVKPIKRIRLPTRRRAAAAAITGLVCAAGGLLWPSGVSSAENPRTHLDRLMPIWYFGEHHSMRVHATPDVVYRAMRAVTADEIALFRTLTWIRSPRVGRAARENIMAPGSGPILDVALTTGFLLIRDDPPNEIVFGTLMGHVPRGPRRPTPEEFMALATPGVIRVLMNFRIDTDAEPGWSAIETDTRVTGSDTGARRTFGMYWHAIYPGSALIRLGWLRAIKTRAESGASR